MVGKFKVWDKKLCRWQNYVHEFFINSEGELCGIDDLGSPPISKCDDRYTPIFSTGKTDKNGGELFDGDAIKCNPDKVLFKYTNGNSAMLYPDINADIGEIFIIKFDNVYCGWSPFCDYDSDCGLYNDPKYFEKIGNKFENPELMETK